MIDVRCLIIFIGLYCGASFAGDMASVVSPGDSLKYSESEFSRLVAGAEAGNVSAMRSLASHYSIYVGDDEEGFCWLLRAADAGDSNSQEFVVSTLQEKRGFGSLGLVKFLKYKWTQGGG